MKKNNLISLLSSLLCLSALGITGCKNKVEEKESYFNSKTSNYSLDDNYQVKTEDDINFESTVTIDLNGKTLDLNNNSLILNSNNESITIKNGTLRNGIVSLTTSSGNINFENVVIDSSIQNDFNGVVTFNNVKAHNIYLNGGSISIDSGSSYDTISTIDNIYTDDEAVYESITVSKHSVVGNIYANATSQINVLGTAANIVLNGDGSFVTAYSYSNINAIYGNAKYLVVDYKDGANVLGSYCTAEAESTAMKYNVEFEVVAINGIPEYTINEVKNLCSETYPYVSYSYVENNVTKVLWVDTVKSHNYSEAKTILEKNYILGELIEYECADCGSHIRELSKADRSISDCENFLDLALLYVPDFNIDFALDEGMTLSLGQNITIESGYVHILSNNGNLGGAVVLDAITGDDESALEQTYKYYLNNSVCYALQGTNIGKQNENISVKEEFNAYDFIVELIANNLCGEEVEDKAQFVDDFKAQLDTYFNYIKAGANIADILIANGDDISKLIVTALTNALGIVLPEGLLDNVNYEELLFDYDNNTYTLDLTNILNVFDYSVGDVIDSLYGEGSVDQIINFVSTRLPNMKVSEIVDYVVRFAKKNKVDSDKIFGVINQIGSIVTGTNFDIYDILEASSNATLNNLESIDAVNAIKAFISKDNLEGYANAKLYDIYDLLNQESGEENSLTYNDLKQQLTKYNTLVDLTFTLKEGNVNNENVSNVESLEFNLYDISAKATEQTEETQESTLVEYTRNYASVSFVYDNSNNEEKVTLSTKSSSEAEVSKLFDGSLAEGNVKFDIDTYNLLPNNYNVKLGYDESVENKVKAYLDVNLGEMAIDVDYNDDQTEEINTTTFDFAIVVPGNENVPEERTTIIDYDKIKTTETLTLDLTSYGLFKVDCLKNENKETISFDYTNKADAYLEIDSKNNKVEFNLHTDYSSYPDEEEKDVKFAKFNLSFNKVADEWKITYVNKLYSETKQKVCDDATISLEKDIENNKTSYILKEVTIDEQYSIEFSITDNDTYYTYSFNLLFLYDEMSDNNKYDYDAGLLVKLGTKEFYEKTDFAFSVSTSNEGLVSTSLHYVDLDKTTYFDLDGELSSEEIKNDNKLYFDLTKSEYAKLGYLFDVDVAVTNIKIKLTQKELLEESTNETRVDTDFNLEINSKKKAEWLDGTEKGIAIISMVYDENYYTYNEDDTTNGLALFTLNLQYDTVGYSSTDNSGYVLYGDHDSYTFTLSDEYSSGEIIYNFDLVYVDSEIAEFIVEYEDSSKQNIEYVLRYYSGNSYAEYRDVVMYDEIERVDKFTGTFTDSHISAEYIVKMYNYDYTNVKVLFNELISNPDGDYTLRKLEENSNYSKRYDADYVFIGDPYDVVKYERIDNPIIDNQDGVTYYGTLDADYLFENNLMVKLDSTIVVYEFDRNRFDVNELFSVVRRPETALVSVIELNYDFTDSDNVYVELICNVLKDLEEYNCYDVYYDDNKEVAFKYNGTTKFDVYEFKFGGSATNSDYSLNLNQYISSYTFPENTFDYDNLKSVDNLIKPDLVMEEGTLINNINVIISKDKFSFTHIESNNTQADNEEDYPEIERIINHMVVPTEELGTVSNDGYSRDNVTIENIVVDEKTNKLHIRTATSKDTHYDANLDDRYYDIVDFYAEITCYDDDETNDCNYGLYIYTEHNEYAGSINRDYKDHMYHEDILNINFSNTEELTKLMLENAADLLEELNINNVDSLGIVVEHENDGTNKYYLVADGDNYNKIHVFDLYTSEDTIIISIVSLPNMFSNRSDFMPVGLKITLSKANDNLLFDLCLNSESGDINVMANIDKDNVLTLNAYDSITSLGFRADLFSSRDLETFENVFDMSKDDFDALEVTPEPEPEPEEEIKKEEIKEEEVKKEEID